MKMFHLIFELDQNGRFANRFIHKNIKFRWTTLSYTNEICPFAFNMNVQNDTKNRSFMGFVLIFFH